MVACFPRDFDTVAEGHSQSLLEAFAVINPPSKPLKHSQNPQLWNCEVALFYIQNIFIFFINQEQERFQMAARDAGRNY